MTDQIVITEDKAGCFLDNHRGHYLSRDMIELATEYGFIIGPFERWALDGYEAGNTLDEYPHEALFELADDALNWLNSGQGRCYTCPDASGFLDADTICMECSGTGRGPRVSGQNFPPIIPDGYHWDWNDGDFGLYPDESEED